MSRHSIHFEAQIRKLKEMMLSLGSLAEESVRNSLTALKERDTVLAVRVINGDEKIDQMEVELEEECLKTLALHQPVANDLRLVISVLKINNDLERIADLATNIAERTIDLSKVSPIVFPSVFLDMGEKAQWMLKASLDAFVELDPGLARKVCCADDEVDIGLKAMYRLVQDEVRHDPERIERLTQVLSVSRYLERMADLATNIAEDIIYLSEGKIIRHQSEVFPKL